jgi:hypothetical protein
VTPIDDGGALDLDACAGATVEHYTAVNLRHVAARAVSFLVSDKRPHSAYSWGWLNRYVESLAWTNAGAIIRPQYAWGTVFAGAQARALNLPAVRVVECGVAGGRGLVALQEIAAPVGSTFGVDVTVVGFDTGEGLPAPTDPRDLPQLYARGEYGMDLAALRAKLSPSITTLRLGLLRETIGTLLEDGGPPLGFISLDVDLYSSSVDVLTALRGPGALTACLPRPVLYLDDSMGLTFSDLTGERLAVREFNEAMYPTRGISPVYGLRYHLNWPFRQQQWPEMLYWVHLLDHPQYGVPDGLIPTGHAPLGS